MYIEAQRKDHQHEEHASGGLICVHMAWALTDEVKVPCMRLRSMDRNTGINTSIRQGWNRDTMFITDRNHDYYQQMPECG